MAEAFLESKPDPLFPCLSAKQLRSVLLTEFEVERPKAQECLALGEAKRSTHGHLSNYQRMMDIHTERLEWDFYRPCFHHIRKACANMESDEFGRCKLQCANCNCRMLFNQLECVKADLETTNETLQVTTNELHTTKQILHVTATELHSVKETLNITSGYLDDTMVELGETKVALEECKKERNEDKRKFSATIARMVQSEMGDVRTQLDEIRENYRVCPQEDEMPELATREAAKAALCASKFIKLRLLMF